MVWVLISLTLSEHSCLTSTLRLDPNSSPDANSLSFRMGSSVFYSRNVLCSSIQTLSLVILVSHLLRRDCYRVFVALEAIEDGYQDYDEAIKEKLFPPG